MHIWFLMIASFFISFLLIYFLISYQRRKKLGQTEREEGPASHKIKNNTPIFGGVGFIVSYFIVFTILLVLNEIDLFLYLLIIFPMISYGLLGFVDDYIILKNRKNEGIRPNIKLLIQIIIAVIYFITYLLFNFDTTIDFLFFKVDIKFLYGIFILLSFSGFTNATNLTDGIDGLLAGTFSIILIGLYFIINDVIINKSIAIIFSGMCAFLYFNLPKAKIFMGDTGSLAIGALFISLMVILKLEIFIFMFGFVYLIETLSVVLQVGYFKITKGKRLFKMAPLHHHFEIVLESEVKTLVLFYLITIFTVITSVFIFLIS